MIRALLLLFDSSRTWEAIKNDNHSVARLSVSFFLPLLGLTCVAEGFLLMHLGIERGAMTERLFKASASLVLRYELTQALLSLLIVFVGASALAAIGVSFRRQHRYRECFTTLAYSLSPLLLLRVLDGVPAIETWVCYGIGIFLTLSLLYRGIPFLLRPDPSNALGFYLFCSFLLLVATALAHFVAVLVLEEKILA